MFSLLVEAIATLLVFTALCNGFCEENLEDNLSVECMESDLTEVPTVDIPNDVQSLDLSSNKLTVLKRVDWKRYSLLETLYLSHNEISIIEEDAFVDLKNLKNLDLSNNNLHKIPPGIFKNNPLLENVNLRGNSELVLPPNSAFLVSQSLISLDLSYCGLTLLGPQTFSQLPNIIHLVLRYNNLTTVSLNTFNFLKNLNALDLSSNKWKCDCGIVDVLNMVSNRRRTEVRHIQHSPVKCLGKGIYKTLWNAARVNKPCPMETTITMIPDDDVTFYVNVVSTRETTNNKSTEGNSETTKTLTTHTPYPSTNFKTKEFTVTDTPLVSSRGYSNAANPTEIDRDFSLWDELLSRKFDVILVVLVLPITLGISIFLSIVAVNRYIHWLELRPEHNDVTPAQKNYRFSQAPLITSFYNEMKSSSDSSSLYSGSTRTDKHIYEEIK